MTPSRTRTLVLALLASAAAAAGRADDPQRLFDLMAQGKTETDLGHFDIATRVLSAIVEAPEATPALRAEALVRLGAARRSAGDANGAMQAFERATKSNELDDETKKLLVQVLGGALPAPKRWTAIASRVSFTADRSDAQHPTLAIVWPDVPHAKHVYRGHPTTLDLKDDDLRHVFRMIADISGLNVVVSPGIAGDVTMKADNEPWDRCLDLMLAANGLTYRWQDNVLFIAKPGDLGPDRTFSGERIDLWWGPPAGPARDVRAALAELAARGGATVVIDPTVHGAVVLKLTQVRWDQAFDILALTNGLGWTQTGKTIKVFPRQASAAH